METVPHQPETKAMESSTISYRRRSVPFYRRPSVAAWAVIIAMAILLTLYFLGCHSLLY